MLDYYDERRKKSHHARHPRPFEHCFILFRQVAHVLRRLDNSKDVRQAIYKNEGKNVPSIDRKNAP
jgi:hypothetical protein